MNESSEWLLASNMSEQSNQKNKKIIIADLKAETLYNLRLFTVDMDYSGFVCKNLTASTKTVKQGNYYAYIHRIHAECIEICADIF